MMSKTEKNGYFLVREEILPEAIKKTIRVKTNMTTVMLSLIISATCLSTWRKTISLLMMHMTVTVLS